jgi:hypothetical protein
LFDIFFNQSFVDNRIWKKQKIQQVKDNTFTKNTINAIKDNIKKIMTNECLYISETEQTPEDALSIIKEKSDERKQAKNDKNNFNILNNNRIMKEVFI